jgi:lipid II:glycine glycyltransferase (peptidoglycan interpeptide bridge formation enzyme)
MEIKEVLEEKPWEEFLTRQPHTSFLQSWAWGEFQDKLGFSHHRFGTYQGGALDGVCQALIGRRKLGSFVYVPRGPILKSFERGRAQETLKYLRNFAAGEKVDYLRVEPHWEASPDLEELFREEGYRRAQVVTSQAGGVSLLLDLSLSEEELLTQMRKTTRYLVKNAAGLGIEIHRSADPRQLEEFHRLMRVTHRRQSFVPQSRNYLQTQFETLAPRGMSELVLAKYQGDILSAAVVFSYGDTVTYVHGASIRSSVPTSYFLLWEIIKEAKKDGYRYFDFWGISPNDNPRHPWYGYSLFKKGFGGYRVDYAGVWDYPLAPKYWVVFGVEKFRRLLKRY